MICKLIESLQAKHYLTPHLSAPSEASNLLKWLALQVAFLIILV